VSHPAGLPDLFIDRSLGRIQVPRMLRAAGLRLTTLAERYGIPDDEIVSDVTWLSEAGQRGEAVFMKDGRVRYNPAEKRAVQEYRVKAFCLARQSLAATAMAQLFLDHIEAISSACHEHKWGLFLVTNAGLRRVVL
jgi:PIN like domain